MDSASTGKRYFLTLVTPDRQPWLAAPRTRDVFLTVLRAWHSERHGRVLAALAMPDHAHVLIELADAVPVEQVITSWKSTARRGAGYAETFQQDFREHRLGPGEKIEDYGLYMLLHPYRARLLKADETWPGWWLPDAGQFTFPSALQGAGSPPLEWLEWPDEKFAGVSHGE